ncbi:1667_t:CDS:2 [Cetraspora pellucida]|uniref:1667_t:CDS:1 n=1 Tax=Cetraspora pellucida TaxID=1433469 RepID=A0A9N9G115_9GLOM|nr:1667_t:CDS:2 [Cetraspora pellucida]
MTGSLNSNKVIVDEELSMQSTNESELFCDQVNFKANFGQLSLEILKFLCQEMGISDVGLKQDLISRLVKEYKSREELSEELFGKSSNKFEGESLEAKVTGVHQVLQFSEEKDKFKKGQKSDAQQEYMSNLFPNLQQGLSFALVELVLATSCIGPSNMNPFTAG